MKKQKTEAENLLFELGIDTGSDDLFQTYVSEIANQKLRGYQEIIQTGAKEGESLYLHILNGIFVLERLRPIFDLDNVEVQILFSAYSVHDINKLPRFANAQQSFSRLATPENITAALAALEIERFFPDYRDYLAEITTLVRGHSGHHHAFAETMRKDFNPYRLDKARVETDLMAIMRAIDSIDLSHSLEERAKKGTFLGHLNSICDEQYEFVYHKVSEQRGILTNLIHNQIVEYLEAEKGLLPLLFYPDGVAYLASRNHAIQLTAEEIITLGKRIVNAVESKTRGEFQEFIKPRPAGIQIEEKCLALNIPFTEIWNEVRNIISGKKYASRIDETNDKCRKRLDSTYEKLAKTKLSKKSPDLAFQMALINRILTEDYYILPPDDNVLRLGELVRTYYIFLHEHFPKAIADAWTHIYDLLGFPLEIEDQTLRPRYNAFDARSDRGYIIGRDLANASRNFDEIYDLITNDGSRLLESSNVASKFGILTDYVRKYVDFSFAAERGGSFAANLDRYVAANHQQCSTCGSEFDTSKWMKLDVPSNIKVQYFSNRLEGGSADEPRRRVCSICQTQYILDKICYSVADSTKTVFIHLYPTSFFTDTLIHAFRKALGDLGHPDFASVLLKNDEALRTYREEARLTLPFARTKVNGNPLPKFSEAVGNILTIPVNAPGDNDTEQMLFALENALLYQRFLGCRAVLTDSSIPLFSGVEFSHFFIDNIPPAFRGWLPNNNLNSEATQLTFDQLLKLHQVRSEIGSIETRDLVKLIRSLNRDVLELYYVAHKLIKNVKAGQDALQFTIMRKTAAPIATVVAQKGGEPIMSHIKDLARIAWDGRLKGESLKDNSLAKPLDVAFESLERWNKDRETLEEARAIMSKEIARAIERLNPRFFGLTKLEKIAEFVDVLFDRIYKEVYQGNLYELLENQKRIRAAYLYFIADVIPRSEKAKEEQQS